MYVLCEKLMPRILKGFCTDDWSGEDASKNVNEISERVQKILEREIENKNKFVFLWVCKENTMPPTYLLMKTVVNLMGVRKLLNKALSHSVIYTPTEASKKWMDFVLSLYTPARPCYLVSTEEELEKMCNHTEENTEENMEKKNSASIIKYD